METKIIDSSKRRFFFTGALGLASLKLGSLIGTAQAKEAKTTDYDLQIERLKAVTAIQNTMARYETFHLVGTEIGNTPQCFALWRDDVTVEVSDGGIVYGAKNVETYWTSMAPKDGKDKNGCIFFHTLATPCIQVAGDSKTAKVTWASPGFEADCGKNVMDGSDHMAVWCFGKYGMDFIKNPKTGEWKIWHQHWFRTTRNDYHKDFVEFARQEDENKDKPRVMPSGGVPTSGPDGKAMATQTPRNNLPTVFHSPLSGLVPHHPFPIDPDPYETYNGDFRWIYGGEEREKRFGVKYAANLEKIYNVDYPKVI